MYLISATKQNYIYCTFKIKSTSKFGRHTVTYCLQISEFDEIIKRLLLVTVAVVNKAKEMFLTL